VQEKKGKKEIWERGGGIDELVEAKKRKTRQRIKETSPGMGKGETSSPIILNFLRLQLQIKYGNLTMRLVHTKHRTKALLIFRQNSRFIFFLTLV
jgi:hypothetical protein